MREELDAKLVEKYPLIFKNRYGNMQETAMCWGFEHGDGWYTIIDTLCSLLTSDYSQAKERYEFCKHSYENGGTWPWRGGKEISAEELEEKRLAMEEAAARVPVASQVKEKFGGLRFYVDSATEKHYNYITFAESMSYRTCEVCGAPGERYTDGWHQTLCETHAKEQGREKVSEEENDE